LGSEIAKEGIQGYKGVGKVWGGTPNSTWVSEEGLWQGYRGQKDNQRKRG